MRMGHLTETEILKQAKYVGPFVKESPDMETALTEIASDNCPDGWESIKEQGSSHYKAGIIEPIDLMRDIPPHKSLTVLMVKALGDIIKYAYRMLVKGANESDCDKIIHYARMVRWMVMRGASHEL